MLRLLSGAEQKKSFAKRGIVFGIPGTFAVLLRLYVQKATPLQTPQSFICNGDEWKWGCLLLRYCAGGAHFVEKRQIQVLRAVFFYIAELFHQIYDLVHCLGIAQGIYIWTVCIE